MEDYQTVCRVSELAESIGRTVYVKDTPIALFRIDGTIHAIDDTCPHMGASLASGFVENGMVTCPWHFWRFRIADGKWADNPRLGIHCYAVRVVGEEVQVQVSDGPGACAKE